MESPFASGENFDWIDLILSPDLLQQQQQQPDDITTMFRPIDFYNLQVTQQEQQQDFFPTNEAFSLDMPQQENTTTIGNLDTLWQEIFGVPPYETPNPLSQISSLPSTTTSPPPVQDLLLPTPSQSPTQEETNSVPTNALGFGFSPIQFVDSRAGSSQQEPQYGPAVPLPALDDESPQNPLKRGNKYGRGGRLRCQKCRDQHGECIFDDLSKPCRRCLKSRTKSPCIKAFGPKKEAKRWMEGQH
jgi:hypothetical protein